LQNRDRRHPQFPTRVELPKEYFEGVESLRAGQAQLQNLCVEGKG
jgi:hypothetical protein